MYSKAQKIWCKKYRAETGFDPLMDEYEAGGETFDDARKRSVAWFDDWSSDVLIRITREPGRRVTTPNAQVQTGRRETD